MATRVEQIEIALKRGFDNKLAKILAEAVKEKDIETLDILRITIENETKNGFIISEVTKAYFRIKRKDLSDCNPLFELWHFDKITVNHSLLDVLGYDKMIPSIKEQMTIIDKYFFYGDDTDNRYFSDPRYGLAAACAGWDVEIVKPFLNNCLKSKDAPLKYVATNSLKRKYVKLR